MCFNVLGKYAPDKQKYNQAKFMNNKLNHAIMVRSRYDTTIYERRNSCVNLLRRKLKL